MKKISFLFSLFLISGMLMAQTQIPNGGFETWSGGNPTGWGSSDKVLTQFFQPDPGGVEQETNAANVFAGTSSVRLSNKSVNIPTVGTQTIPGVVSLGDISLDLATFSPRITGLAYTDRPDSITFAGKYNKAPGSTDTGAVVVTLTRWTGTDRQIIANVFVQVPDGAAFNVYTEKIRYFSFFNPDTLLIQGLSGASQAVAVDSKLWLDEMSFIGLDTAFKAYITPFQDRQACAGDTVEFSTDDISGNTYTWYEDGVAVSTSPTYGAVSSGDYFVEVVYNGTTYVSDTINLVVNTLPIVTLPSLPVDTLCNQANVVVLSGGTPAGGEYSGNGVANNEFTPADALVGVNEITYTYEDVNGCSASASQNIVLKLCTSIEVLEPGINMSLYPNPANDYLMLNTDNALVGGTILIYDLQGKLVASETIRGAFTQIATTQLSFGTYSVKIVNSESRKVANAKVVVAH
jgi:hypothetical protein